jgi:hypothetical protein
LRTTLVSHFHDFTLLWSFDKPISDAEPFALWLFSRACGTITTFACLDRVAAGARHCMGILQQSDGGQWTLQTVPPR